MTSRKSIRPRFAGVAAWSFRKAGFVALLGLSTLSTPAWAQTSPFSGLGLGGGLGGAATSALGTGAVAPAAAPRTLWGFLGLSSANLGKCRDKLCSCQAGQMLNSLMAGPMGAISGGLICPLCPPVPNANQIAALEKKPNGGAEAAAAKIKASEADAKARVAAVEYLGTVDCNWFPEARKGLLSSLREDPNECVRYAAARALGNGCCCNQEVIESLKICVSGESKGGPSETSPRVRAAAFAALQNCLMRVPEEVEAPKPETIPPEGGRGLPEPLPDAKKRLKPEGTASNTADPAAITTSLKHAAPGPRTLEEEVQTKPFAQTVAEARQILFETARHPQTATTLPPGKRSVFQALSKARKDVDGKARPNVQTPVPARDPGVVPSSFVAPQGAQRGSMKQVPDQGSGSALWPYQELQQQTKAPKSPTPPKRGLLELLIKPRDEG